MLPWVVLGAILVIGLLLSVIYTGVMFIIDGLIITAVVWFILGLIFCGNYSIHFILLLFLFFLLRKKILLILINFFFFAFSSHLRVHVVCSVQSFHNFA